MFNGHSRRIEALGDWEPNPDPNADVYLRQRRLIRAYEYTVMDCPSHGQTVHEDNWDDGWECNVCKAVGYIQRAQELLEENSKGAHNPVIETYEYRPHTTTVAFKVTRCG